MAKTEYILQGGHDQYRQGDTIALSDAEARHPLLAGKLIKVLKPVKEKAEVKAKKVAKKKKKTD
jgi:hypothetical protein